VYGNSTNSSFVTIGNAAPVQDRSTGRIVVPFCRNNLQVLVTYSEDDGLTWSAPVNISNVTLPEWKWIGLGPPASLQLSNGRLIVPSYHGPFSWDDGEFTHGHLMLSDDGGSSWRLGAELTGIHLSNECQAAELENGTVFINSRSLGTDRLKTYSDDGGDTVGETTIINGLRQPLEGCEGSTIRLPNSSYLLFSIPNDIEPYRYNLSVFLSRDDGMSWSYIKTVNPGPSAYSALAVLPNGSVGMLFERSDVRKLVFVPQHISFTVVLTSAEVVALHDESSRK